MKAFVLNLSLAGGAMVALVLLAELALQIAVPLLKPRFTRVDPLVGWYHTPGVSGRNTVEGHTYRVSYNSHGYRAPERSLTAKPGRSRIVVLGDSFVDGSEVGDQEVLTWQLEERLPNTDVINLGVYGYQTTQEYLTLDHVGLRFSPDIVVLVVVSNDLPGNVIGFESFGPAPRFVLDGDSIRLEGLDHPSTRAAFRATNLPAPSWVHRRSLVYYVLNHYIYHRLAANRIRRFRDRRLLETPPEEQRELFRRIIRGMQQLSGENDIPFIVVFAYLRDQLLENEASPLSGVIDLVREDGVHVIDLFEPLRAAEAATDSSLYYRYDVHWNARGHRVMAELLEPTLRSLLDSIGAVRRRTLPPIAALEHQLH